MPPAGSPTRARFSRSNAAAAGAGPARHRQPHHGPLRRAALAACTAALHAVTALCQSSFWLDVLICTLIFRGDNNLARLGIFGASKREASGATDWRVTLALVSLGRAINPEANATNFQFASGFLDILSMCASLLLPHRWQKFGAAALACICPFLYIYLKLLSQREAQAQGPQAPPSQRQQTTGSGTAGSVANGASAGAARGAYHLLFSLCYWVPAARATAALSAFSLRCFNKVWRFVTFRRAHSAGPWPLLPALITAAALELWAWQSAADSLVLHRRWKEVGQLRERLPPEEAGCWPLLALRRCLQLAVIQLSGQPPESVLGAPPLPLPFALRLLRVANELAQTGSLNLRTQLATAQASLMANTVDLLLSGFLLSMFIFSELLHCVAYLLAAIPWLGIDIQTRLRAPARPAAAFSWADAEGAPSRAGAAAAFARAAGTPAPFHFSRHAQPSTQTAAPGGAGSSSSTGRSGGVPGAPLVFSAAGLGEEGAVQRPHGSRQRYRQPQGRHEHLQPNSSGTAAVHGPAGRINRDCAAADAAGQPALPDAARPAQEDHTAAVRVGLPAPAQPQPAAHVAGQATRSAVSPAIAQPEESVEPAVPLEPAVPVVPALLPEADALKQCAACGAERGEGDRKLRKCSGCMSVRFCSPACAKQHWPVHKQLCKQLQRLRREAEQH